MPRGESETRRSVVEGPDIYMEDDIIVRGIFF